MHTKLRESALQIFAEIKSSCENVDDYHQVLSDIILTNRISLKNVHMSLSNIYRELVFRELHHSWSHSYTVPSSLNEFKIKIPEILVWGYESRLKRIKEACFNNFSLRELDPSALTAFWEAIKISGITTFKELYFNNQTIKSWKITLNGIKHSSLESLHFGNTFSEISLDSWQLLWNTLQNTSVRHLDLCFASFHHHEERFWEIFFDGLEHSNLVSMSLERMNLAEFSTEQWNKLYKAIRGSRLTSLNLTCNHLHDTIQSHSKNNPASWEIICNIIRLPSLKHLKWLETYGPISDTGWNQLCAAFKDSRLEQIEFSVDADKNEITEERWLVFLNSLKKLPLRSLYLYVESAHSISEKVLQGFCDLLEVSSISSFILQHYYGSLNFSVSQWQLLCKRLGENGIDTLNIGSINLENQADFMNFALGIKGSGIKRLYLPKINSGQISSERWMQLASLLKEEGITDLNLIGNYMDCSPNENTWPDFCQFIVNSEITKIAFSASNSNEMPLPKIKLLSEVIPKSKLESFSFEGLKDNIQRTPWQHFQILCTAFNNSKIYELIHSWTPGKNELRLSPPKREILLKTMKTIQPRALFRKSLGELCAFSLLNANARLTSQGMELQVEKTSIETALDEEQKNILREYGIS